MMYILATQDERFLAIGKGDNKPYLTTLIEKAFKFSHDKANNMINENFMSVKWSLKPIEEGNKIKKEEDVTMVKKEFNYDLDEEINRLQIFTKDLKERNNFLNLELSRIDKEVVDIEHAMEFYVLNASQGYKLYKMMHDAKNARREVKNEMEKIRYILDSTMKDSLNGNLTKSMNKVDNKKYTPRILKELFGV